MRYLYTWREFDKDVEKIVSWVGRQNFKSVYGVPRGGLIVGVVLSHRLGLPLKLKVEELDQETLVVDDIADSGRTLENLDKVLKFKPVAVTLFFSKDGRRRPDFYIREKKDWVVFPWESEKSSRYDSVFKRRCLPPSPSRSCLSRRNGGAQIRASDQQARRDRAEDVVGFAAFDLQVQDILGL